VRVTILGGGRLIDGVGIDTSVVVDSLKGGEERGGISMVPLVPVERGERAKKMLAMDDEEDRERGGGS
ncbi:hypothetical protein KI387_025524, partial [Taxus chinensis]